MANDGANTNPADMELSELINELIDGSISEQQFVELTQRLKSDPLAHSEYLNAMELESMLYGRVSKSKPSNRPIVGITSNNSWGNGWLNGWRGIGAITVAVGLLLGGLIYAITVTVDGRSDNKGVTGVVAPLQKTNEVTGSSVARVTNGLNLTWGDESRNVLVGSWLPPGLYELAEGSAEVTFDSGAVVSIAGQAVFEIIDSNKVRLIRGSLEADVPEQAIGFKVQTPTGEITDLSTQFAVAVSSDGISDVHVLKGLVEAKPNSAGDEEPSLLLTENLAMRMSADSLPQPVEFSSNRMLEFGSRNNKQENSYIHFSFDEEEVATGKVPNLGSGGGGQGGKMVAGSAGTSFVQVPGRFGKAMFFAGIGASVETPIKGIAGNGPRTVMCWVRINPKTSKKNAYSFVAWGAPGKVDGKKWQIGWNPIYVDDEGVKGAVRTEFGGGYVIGSTDLRDGRWHHIASVFTGVGDKIDVATQVRHYVDGKLERVSGFKKKEIQTQSDQHSLVLGSYLGGGTDFFGSYKGWLDEVFVYDVALTPSQIVQIMEKNQPPKPSEIVASAVSSSDNTDD